MSPCLDAGGAFSYLDEYFGALKRRLGRQESDVVDYYVVPDGAELYSNCVKEAREDSVVACANKYRIFTEALIHEHELVHAAKPAPSHPVFEEGAAVFWGDDYSWLITSQERHPIGDVFADASPGRIPWDTYAVVGHFVSYLVTDVGDEADFLDLSTRVGQRSKVDDVDAALRRTYDMGLSDVAEDYDANAPWCSMLRFHDPSPKCEIAQSMKCGYYDEWGAIMFEASADLDCDGEATIGPENGAVWVNFTFVAPQSGPYGVRVYPMPDIDFNDIRIPDTDLTTWGQVVIESCEAGCQHRFESGPTALGFYGDTIYELEAGVYRVLVRRYLDAPSTLSGKTITGFLVRIRAPEGVDVCPAP